MSSDYGDTQEQADTSEHESIPETSYSLSPTGIESMQGPPDVVENEPPDRGEEAEAHKARETEKPEPIEETDERVPDRPTPAEEEPAERIKEPTARAEAEPPEEPEPAPERPEAAIETAEPIESDVAQEAVAPEEQQAEGQEAEEPTQAEGQEAEEPTQAEGQEAEEPTQAAPETTAEGEQSPGEPGEASPEGAPPVEEPQDEPWREHEHAEAPAEAAPEGIRFQDGTSEVPGPADSSAESPPLDEELSESSLEPEPPSDASEYRIVGDPEGDAQYYYWQGPEPHCAIVAQDGILQKMTGESPGQDALLAEAREKGWYDNGTHQADVGKHLDTRGIPTREWPNSDMNALLAEIEQGHPVIACVDAGCLWEDGAHLDEGHAVWVTGLQVDHAGKVVGVFLNDSGRPDDGGDRVDAAVFESAWSKLDHSLITIEGAAPARAAAGGYHVNPN
ncbi:MAG: hypothetical protein JXA93_12060 [Anaerolineae bacterium]|nr:hypothetical protein [Anaerolineae bacterium]